ncbi:MAG: hypothetical protein KKG01_03670, partial [Candidatus Omnitrophica bacterium]|nr:hypothetical protein [Candidatus Omnitrophota bacterium]
MITVDEALAGGMLAKRYDKIALQIAQGQIDIDTFLQVFTFFLISDDNALMANTIEFLESGHLLESSGVGPEAIRRLEALLDDANNGAQLAQRISTSFIENRALWAPMPNETILSHSRRYPEVADAFAQGLANLTIEDGNLATRAASMLLNMARYT